MSKVVFGVCLAIIVTILVSQDAMSAPQFSTSFGGSNGTSIGSGGVGNSSSNVPGGGYAGDYYANHSNETAPTSPSVSGGDLNLNSTAPSNACDCNNLNNVQEMAPTNAGATNSPSDGSDASSAASSSSSSRK